VANEQLTAADKSPEEIQYEMSRTREALTEKVAALENQVVGTVQSAADTLTDTVESVKSIITTAPGAVGDSVKQAAAAVSETMKKTFDISCHVREHPWTAVGVSAFAGCITGWLVSSLVERERTPRPPSMVTPSMGYSPPSEASSKPGVFDELLSMLGRKFREVAENAIESASSAVNQTVREGVPKLIGFPGEAETTRLSSHERGNSYRAGFAG
jgi:ElaB/YqjD/DUF883 family membrane-anchored ribosome-binding protein